MARSRDPMSRTSNLEEGERSGGGGGSLKADVLKSIYWKENVGEKGERGGHKEGERR